MLGSSCPPITLAPKGVGGFFWPLGFLADMHSFKKIKINNSLNREKLFLSQSMKAYFDVTSLSSPVQTTLDEQGKWRVQIAQGLWLTPRGARTLTAGVYDCKQYTPTPGPRSQPGPHHHEAGPHHTAPAPRNIWLLRPATDVARIQCQPAVSQCYLPVAAPPCLPGRHLESLD